LPATHGDDAQVIAACLATEGRAWDAVAERHKRLVHVAALRAGLAQEDAASVLQAAFVCLQWHLHTPHAAQRLAAWLIRTIRRESWGVRRKREREEVVSNGDDSDGGARVLRAVRIKIE
jgi:DNA-directed RNA polymerase specialized sigma24 family protein